MEHAAFCKRKRDQKRQFFILSEVAIHKSFHLCLKILSNVYSSMHKLNRQEFGYYFYLGLLRLRMFRTSEQNRRQSSIGSKRSTES